MLGGMRKVFVRREQRHFVSNAELRKQCINGADLDSRAAASIAQGRRVNVVIPIRLEERQHSKAFDNLGLRLGSQETLQKLLQNQPRSDDHL